MSAQKAALVLGGGSIKGAWQAGAIKSILDNGFQPSMITGISVGSLNAVFLADAAGKYRREGKAVDWPAIGEALFRFWKKRITGPETLIRRKNAIKLGWRILRKKFDGLTDPSPLHELLNDTVSIDKIRQSDIDLKVGCVNLNSGSILYAEPHFTHFMDYVLGSSAIPFIMPTQRVDGQSYVDGGVIDSAPLDEAVKSQNKVVLCIGCHPKEASGVELNTGDVVQLADRLMDLISANNLNNDIDKARLYNELLECSEGEYLRSRGKRPIDLRILRPDVAIETDITDFSSTDIDRMLADGRAYAEHFLKAEG